MRNNKNLFRVINSNRYVVVGAIVEFIAQSLSSSKVSHYKAKNEDLHSFVSRLPHAGGETSIMLTNDAVEPIEVPSVDIGSRFVTTAAVNNVPAGIIVTLARYCEHPDRAIFQMALDDWSGPKPACKREPLVLLFWKNLVAVELTDKNTPPLHPWQAEAGFRKGELKVCYASRGSGKSRLTYNNLISSQPKETLMKFEQRYYLNGRDITAYSDEEIFDCIKQEEAAIDRLKQIVSQPKQLKEAVANRKAVLAQLVEYLDAR